jgi:hypothetical protein
VLLVLHSASFESAKAAQSTLLEAEQTLRAQYGESLTFSVRTTAPAVLMNAHLTIRILNRNADYRIPVSIKAGSTVNIDYRVLAEEIDLLPATTLTYFWEFQDDAGQNYQTAPVMQRYGDSQVPWEWAERRSGQIVMLSAIQDDIIEQAVLDVATRSLSSSTELLGTSIDGDVVIYVYPGLASMANSLRKHQTVVQDWVAAYAIPQQQTIFISAEPGPDALINLEKDLPHEMMHLAVYAASGGNIGTVPGWLNEGLALQADAANTDPTLQDVLGKAIASRVLLSLATLCAPNFSTLPPRDAALAYSQSGSIVKYIVQRYGASQISALVKAYGTGLTCSQGTELVLGISLNELETQWLKDLSNTASSPAEQSHSVVPWLVAWAFSLILAGLFIFPQPLNETALFDTRVALPRVPLDVTRE